MKKSDRDRIANRIRLMLQKTVANGCTEEEAANAMSIAAKLMAQHNLARGDVSASAPPAYTKEQAYEDTKCPLHYVFSTRVIEVVSQVHCVIIQQFAFWGATWRIEVFGDSDNVAAGVRLLQYLAGAYSDLYVAYRARSLHSETMEAGYYEGLRAGLLVRLEREAAEREREQTAPKGKNGKSGASGQPGTVLARSQAHLDEAFKAEYGNPPDLTVGANQASFEAGCRDSERISLRPAIRND